MGTAADQGSGSASTSSGILDEVWVAFIKPGEEKVTLPPIQVKKVWVVNKTFDWHAQGVIRHLINGDLSGKFKGMTDPTDFVLVADWPLEEGRSLRAWDVPEGGPTAKDPGFGTPIGGGTYVPT